MNTRVILSTLFLAGALAFLPETAAGAPAGSGARKGVFSRKAAGPVTVSGKVLDKADGNGAGFATVALIARDSTVAAAGTADAEGSFTLQADAGEYTLSVSLMGYRDFRRSIALEGGTVDAGEVLLEQDAEMLAAAKISEKVPLVEMKLDKVVMNVRESAFAQGNNGLELLRKAPGVTIDKDGNVKLNGQSVDIWIDGRPSHLSGDALKNMLKGTSGENIDKIELIANPSAKYDAAGQGGIINIKTRRNSLAGLNGTVSLEGAGMYLPSLGRWGGEGRFSSNIGWRTKKTNVNFNFGESGDSGPFTMKNSTWFDTTAGSYSSESSTLHTMGYSSRRLKVSGDWFLDEDNILGAIVSAPSFNYGTVSKPEENLSETFLDGISTEKTRSRLEETSKSPQYSANLNYTHTFDKEKSSEMMVNLDWYRNLSDSRSLEDRYADGDLSAILSKRDVDSHNAVDILSAKVDWEGIAFEKVMMEAGGKWASSRTANSMTIIRTGQPDYNSDFTFHEDIGALYASAAAQLGQKFSIKAGLRGEYTHFLGDWDSDGRSYFDLFPSATLSWSDPGKTMMALSYTRRISRPHFSQLDPTPSYYDARSYTVGNRDLRPEYTDNTSLTAGFGQNFSLSASWGHTTDLITQSPSYGADGSQILTWKNFGNRNIYSLSANITYLPVTKWLSWTLSASGMIIDTKPAFSSYTCLSFDLPKDWKVEWDGFWSAGMIWGLFEIGPFGGSAIAAKKTLMDGKMTLTIKADDIFNTMRQKLNVLNEDKVVTSTLEQNFFAPRVGLGLSWNFGKSQQGRRRNVGSLEEAERAGKSGSIGK